MEEKPSDENISTESTPDHKKPVRGISFPVDAVLQSAVSEGDVMEILHLLNHESDLPNVNKRNHMGMTALHQTVLQNNLDCAKILICHGANVDAQDSNGFSPLHAAAACGCRNMVALLIMFGADVFLTTNDGDLPIDLAKDTKTCKLLQAVMVETVHTDLYLISWCKYYFLEFCTALYKFSSLVYTIIMESIKKYRNEHEKEE